MLQMLREETDRRPSGKSSTHKLNVECLIARREETRNHSVPTFKGTLGTNLGPRGLNPSERGLINLRIDHQEGETRLQ